MTRSEELRTPYEMVAEGEITEEISAQHDLSFETINHLRAQHSATIAALMALVTTKMPSEIA